MESMVVVYHNLSRVMNVETANVIVAAQYEVVATRSGVDVGSLQLTRGSRSRQELFAQAPLFTLLM
jgi:hypothetical protein